MLTQERLKEKLYYCPETGGFTWAKISKQARNIKVGDMAGYLNNGSRKISIDGGKYYASALAFLYMTGEIPKRIEHLNGVVADDRFDNLRAFVACEQSKPLVQSRLKEFLHYDPASGVFTWKKRHSNCAKGDIAGSIDDKGYIRFAIDCNNYRAHRLAYLYMVGEWPADTVDHINGIKHDNRWDNLRVLTNDENLQNRVKPNKGNISNLLGVHKTKTPGGWTATIGINKKHIYLGHFRCKYKAHDAYLEAKKKYHPASCV